jgi:hypothetical protein
MSRLSGNRDIMPDGVVRPRRRAASAALCSQALPRPAKTAFRNVNSCGLLHGINFLI